MGFRLVLWRWGCWTLVGFSAGCGGIARSDGPGGGAPALLCEDGQLRLAEESCGDGSHIVERCEDEVWYATEECRQPDGCEEGAVIETGEQCGDRAFNRRLQRCSGGLLQDGGCSCGAENPSTVLRLYKEDYYGEQIGPADAIQSQEDAAAHANVTFPSRLIFNWGDEFTGFDHIRCVETLIINGSFPPLPGLRGVGFLALSGSSASGLDNLEEAGRIELRSPLANLDGFGSLREVDSGLIIYSQELESLDGLESLRRTGNLNITAPQLKSVRALSSLETVDGFLSTSGASDLTDLTGLHNLRTVGGRMSIRVTSSEQIRIFEKLESVGEDLFVGAPSDLVCEAGMFFSQKSIGGTLTVGSSALGPFDPSACE